MVLTVKREVHGWKEFTCNSISFLLKKNGIKSDSNQPVTFSMRCKMFFCERKEAFFPLKRNKSPGYEEISSSVISKIALVN